MDETADLSLLAQEVLLTNDHGKYTIPAEGLYPHQWLWDSCFIAIGMRHYDVERAQTELISLLRGQWSNGMLPHMIFAAGEEHYRDKDIWRSWLNPHAPSKVATSGMTQPPMLAEAVCAIGEKLNRLERRTLFHKFYTALLAHHQWLYNERDPHNEGLTLQVHSWETGMDNTPPWMSQLHDHKMPLWVRLADNKFFSFVGNLIRRDHSFATPGERLTAFEAAALYSVQHRLRRKAYDIDKILSHSLFAIEDLTFNSILIRANHHLRYIAKTIGKQLPEELRESMRKTESSLELLWDTETGQYYSRDFVTHNLIKVPSIATLMPLYSGKVSKERAAELVKLLKDKKQFGLQYPVPSTPQNTEWFRPHGYWRGPVWINTNWLIIDGLKQYGFKEEAAELTKSTIELIEKSGFYEYFSPLDGTPAGVNNFSWSAALTIDLLIYK